MLETQITQAASFSSRAQGRFSGQPEINPIEHYNVIILRSGKTLEKPQESIGEQVEVTHMLSKGGEDEKESEGKDEEPNPLVQVMIDHPYCSLNGQLKLSQMSNLTNSRK